MNTTDLRIEYKRDTGNYPLLNYSNCYNTEQISFTGELLHEPLKYDYVKWLEEKFGGSNKFRYMYLEQYGIEPLSTYLPKKYFRNRVKPEVFYNEYCWWLEDYIVENILNKHSRTYIY
jgi:hypothetical protein